jgi:hypothetical protein
MKVLLAVTTQYIISQYLLVTLWVMATEHISLQFLCNILTAVLTEYIVSQ